MSEKIVDEQCVACGHSIGKHFTDVIGRVRCLQVVGQNNRMTGEFHQRECACVDYAVGKPVPPVEKEEAR